MSESLPLPFEAARAVAVSGRAAAEPPVPIEQPLALFVPGPRLATHLPVPVVLPELLPGTVNAGYDRSERGLVARDADRFLRHEITLGNARVLVSVNGSQEYGLPSSADYDFLWALFHLIDTGAGDGDGVLRGVSFRRLVDLAQRPMNARSVAAAKRALLRFSAAKIRTRLRLTMPPDAPDAIGIAGSMIPGEYRSRAAAWPVLLEHEQTYNVLDVSLSRLRSDAGAGNADDRERLDAVRIEPLWLREMRTGYTAWLNWPLHCTLDNLVAKRLLQVGTLAVARRTWRPGEPWEMSLGDARTLLGLEGVNRPAKVLDAIRTACAELEQYQAVRVEVIPGANRRQPPTLRWWMGPTFLASHGHRAVAPADPPEVRVLVWHLTAAGLADPEARAWVAEDAGYVRELLRWMYWHRTELGGRSSPAPGAQVTRSWSAWLRTGWKRRWAFEDERYRAWVQRVTGGMVPEPLRAGAFKDADRLLPAAQPGRESPLTDADQRGRDGDRGDQTVPLAGSTGITWPDDVWGRAAAVFAQENAPAALMWLVDSVLVAESDDAVVVRVRDALAADKVNTRLRHRLEVVLADVRGRPTELRVERPDVGGTSSGAST